MIITSETPNRFHHTLVRFVFTVRYENNEPRVVENIDLRIRTAPNIANTGPAKPIHDGHHCLHEERVGLVPKETKTLAVTMPVFMC